MNRDEIRAYVRDNPIAWPDLSDQQRSQLAALLRQAPTPSRSSKRTARRPLVSHQEAA